MSKPAKTQPRDPRFKAFRVAMYGVYLLAVGIISVLVIISVVGSVLDMSRFRKADQEPTLTVRECLATAESLWRELEKERQGLTAQPSARKADDAWSKFRVGWLDKKRNAEAHCALGSKNREAVKDVYEKLERVMDLYTIHATQYAGEIGFKVDELRESLKAARRDPSAGKLP